MTVRALACLAAAATSLPAWSACASSSPVPDFAQSLGRPNGAIVVYAPGCQFTAQAAGALVALDSVPGLAVRVAVVTGLEGPTAWPEELARVGLPFPWVAWGQERIVPWLESNQLHLPLVITVRAGRVTAILTGSALEDLPDLLSQLFRLQATGAPQ